MSYPLCKRGHERSPENLYNRTCKICNRLKASDKINEKPILSDRGYEFCKRGHERSPENVYVSGSCKICTKMNINEWRNNNQEQYKTSSKKWKSSNSEKVKEYSKKSYSKEETKQRLKKYKKENPDKVKKLALRYRKENNESVKKSIRQWVINNPDKVQAIHLRYRNNEENRKKLRERVKNWCKRNPDKASHNCSKYRTKKLLRSPSWLTKEQLRQISYFYMTSVMLTRITGIRHHVDHIIPLQGKNVSGLHVPWNLQVITADENMRKHNKLVSV